MKFSEPKLITISLAILFLLSTLLGVYSWKQKNSLELTNQSLGAKVADLTSTHDDLLADIEKLENDLGALLSTNEKQKNDLEEANNTIAKSKKELAALRKKYAKDIGWMKAEIKNLRAAKKELTDLVALLKKEKASGSATDASLLDSRLAEIETRKKELEEQLAKAREENNALLRDNKTLDITAIRATNTRVDLFKKGYKPTRSFKRAREIVVSFNLSHLAATKQGVHDLFVVIKDAKGNLVEVPNPIKKKITSHKDGQIEEIIAQQMITSDLFDKVRLQFKVAPEKGSLQKGFYRVYIYAEWGLIGGTEFELR